MKKYYNLLSKRLLLINITYMLVFTIIAYSATLIYVKNDFKLTEQKKADILISNFNDMVSQGNNIANSLSLDETIKKYVISDAPDPKDIYYIKNIISLYYTNSEITTFAVVNPIQNHAVIINRGSILLPSFEELFGLEDTEFINNVHGLYSKNSNDSVFMTASNGEKSYFVNIISREINKDAPVIFVHVYDLNHFFSGISKNDVPTAFVIETEQNNLKFAYNNETASFIPLTEITDKISYKNVTSRSDISSYSGIITCSVYATYFKYLLHINNFFLLMLLLIIALFFIGYIFIKTNANILYTPVKKALALLPNDITNNNSEFGAFEKYITSLSSQRDVMAEIITDNKIQMSDKFLFKVLTSTLSNIEIKEGITNYGFENVKFPIVSFIVSYRNFNVLKDILSNEGLNEVRQSVHEYFNNIFKNYKFFKLIDLDQQNIAGIVSTDNAENFVKEIKTAALGIEMLMDIDLSIFVGKSADSWREIAESYSSASDIKDKYWVIPNQNIVISANTNDTEKYSQIIYYSSSLEEELINNVLSGNKELAVNQLDKIIDTNMEGKALTREHYSQLVIMLYSTFTKLFTIINKTEKDIFDSVRIYLELMSCQDAQSLKLKTTEFITTIISNISITQETEFENEKEMILSYIHSNYKNDITLFTLADHLNLSQIYASKKFKQCIGESFKDYLTNYRLDIAMEMMKKNPKENLSTIAESVGFTSRTFTRAFTQKYGMTPSHCIQKLK